MEKTESKLSKILQRTAIIVFTIISILALSFYIYTFNYYKADATAKSIKYSRKTDQYYIFDPDSSKDLDTGLIFYPGGKVEALAYAPLMKELSDQGLTVVLAEMPFNLAVFDIEAANGAIKLFKGIDNWYIGGHSLGGAMASSYLKDSKYQIKGLILLGAYPVSKMKIPILAIIGSNDKVVNRDKVAQLENPYIIEGGNHGNYGNYGFQKGDGKATISRAEQQRLTTDAIMNFINENN